MSRDGKENIEKAKSILHGKYEKPQDILNVSSKLKKDNSFGLARKILNRALQDGEIENDKNLKLKIAQQQALCTYKDPDLPISDRLDRALKILDKADNLRETENQETLGLAGAVFKRKWEVEGHKHYLECSLGYYLRGYNIGLKSDFGYTAINAAYVLDLLAHLENENTITASISSTTSNFRKENAKQIREDIVSVLPGLVEQNDWLEREYWFLVTIAEAYFGLKNYDESRPWLQKAAALPDLPPWELETTARQLAAIFRLQSKERLVERDIEKTPAWEVLKEFLGDKAEGVRTIFLGKVGLALFSMNFRRYPNHKFTAIIFTRDC